MRAMIGLLPFAVVLVVVAGAVWWSLDRGSAMGAWLVAAILFAHGWVHLVFLLPNPAHRSAGSDAGNPFDLDRSWLSGRGVEGRLVHSVGAVLAVVTFVALAAAAAAVLEWLVPASWWAALTVAGVAGSTTLLVLFFAPALVLGFVIDAGLLALVFQTAWQVPR
ncbi:hypothetical protein [Nocardia seriolae]|nr:hypothetical protein [Nocardia seriolae]QOW35385.1 hypothetical protein IMZ23_10770 [Nocardia seriolae]QUN17146.1 hypothetical protein KEC46_34230 [Nocardia seriolae]WNJ62681.1 hypothetical protein RMO66_19455 [Nocardia seriolae]